MLHRQHCFITLSMSECAPTVESSIMYRRHCVVVSSTGDTVSCVMYRWHCVIVSSRDDTVSLCHPETTLCYCVVCRRHCVVTTRQQRNFKRCRWQQIILQRCTRRGWEFKRLGDMSGTWRTLIWLSGNALASINVVALRQTRLVPGWVTVCGRVNHLGM